MKCNLVYNYTCDLNNKTSNQMGEHSSYLRSCLQENSLAKGRCVHPSFRKRPFLVRFSLATSSRTDHYSLAFCRFLGGCLRDVRRVLQCSFNIKTDDIYNSSDQRMTSIWKWGRKGTKIQITYTSQCELRKWVRQNLTSSRFSIVYIELMHEAKVTQ